MLAAATADSNFKGLSAQQKNEIRARQLKQMLLAYIG